MRRRDFIRLLGCLLGPRIAQAEETAVPVIGFLTSRGPNDAPQLLAAFRQGLKDSGFIEGRSVTIDYRFASNRNERLPAMADELVELHVNAIVATAIPAAIAAKGATSTIPIVFEMGGDPVRVGVVSSLNRPGGNVTGVSGLNVEVAPKRLELLREILPAARTVGFLVNPSNPATQEQAATLMSSARSLGFELNFVRASGESDFDAAFAELVQIRADGLAISSDPFFTARQSQIAALALRNNLPAVYESREFVAAGGLLGYGGSLTDTYRLTGVYTGRVLKGEKPSDLPIQQSTKVELFLNVKTAEQFGLKIPLSLLGRADEVIE